MGLNADTGKRQAVTRKVLARLPVSISKEIVRSMKRPA
jgi:hypothetical protein